MTTTLQINAGIERELLCALDDVDERAGVLLARPVLTPTGQVRLLSQSIEWVPPQGYATRTPHSLDIRPEGYITALSEAAGRGCVPVWLHTHPGEGSNPQHSRHDDVVDDQLADLFRLRADSTWYGSLVVARENGGLRFAGRLRSSTEDRSIDRIWVVGDRLRLLPAADASWKPLDSDFDRNVRAFGGPVQQTLQELTVAVVGCGGTGSGVAEQLARLGVGHLVLVDLDVLSGSNVTRVYGSTAADVGRAKCDLLAEHLRRINPNLVVTSVLGSVTSEATARALTDADLLFGCTDDNAGRVVLSRLAVFYAVPFFDVGVILDSAEDGRLRGIDGRVTSLMPGAACLICRDRIDLPRAQSESLTPDERKRRADEGYAPGLPGVEPAVVTFTTMVAAYATSELIERLTGFGPEEVPSELIIRVHDREVSANLASPQPGHYCDPAVGAWGRGDAEPFLERSWSA